MHKYVQERRRDHRVRNLITALRELHAAHPEATEVSTSRVRRHVRERLGLPELTGQAWLGDLRANGDALGGHGLELEIVRRKIDGAPLRMVQLNEGNFARLAAYERKWNGAPVGSLV